MAKAYTDIAQSKRLSKILPVESADMYWVALNWQETEFYADLKQEGLDQPKIAIHSWSLAALMAVLPKINGLKPMVDLEKNSISYSGIDLYVTAESLVDVCVETIIILHEKGLL